MAVTLGDALLFLKANSDQLNSDLDAAGSQARSWASNVGSAVNQALKLGVTAAIGGVSALVGGTLAATKVTSDWYQTLDSLGDVLGTDTRESAALAVAIENVGGNVEAVTGQFTFMARGLETSKGKLGPVGQELKDLGINVYDAQGNLKDINDIIPLVANKFSAMPDGIEKSALMTRVLGRSGKDLSDVMNELANGGLARADEKAKALGLSMSDETAAGFFAMGKQVTTIQQTLRGFAVTIGTAVMPIVSGLLTRLLDFAQSEFVVGFFDRLRIALGLISDGNIASGIIWLARAFGLIDDAGVAAAGDLAIAWQGTAAQAIEYITFILQDLADLLDGTIDEDVIPNLAADLASLGNLFGLDGMVIEQFVTNALQTLIAGLTQVGAFITSTVLPALAQFVDFISANAQPILIGLAAVVAAVIVPALIAWAASAAAAAASTLLALAPLVLIGAAVAVLAAAWINDWGGIQEKTQAVIDFIMPYIQAALAAIQGWWTEHGAQVMTAVATLWANIQTAAAAAMGALQAVIGAALVWLQGAWAQNGATIQATVQALFDILGGIVNAFVALATGDWQGLGTALQGVWQNVWTVILNVAQMQTSAVLGALSALAKQVGAMAGTFAAAAMDIGKNLIDGIVKGIQARVQAAIDAIKKALQDLLDAARSAVEGHSPARAFIPLGQDIMAGIAAGIQSGTLLPAVELRAALTGMAQPAPAPVTPIVVNATINQPLDIEDLAYRIFEVAQQRGR